MNVERQERTRPETRDQSSCSPCAVNALCSISLVVWHYFWRPRRRRVAALLLWCMTRRDWVRSYSGDSTSKHTEIFCVRLGLWLFLFWLFLMRPMVFPVGGYWLVIINELGSQVLRFRMRVRKVFQWISHRKGKGSGMYFGQHSKKDWQSMLDQAHYRI